MSISNTIKKLDKVLRKIKLKNNKKYFKKYFKKDIKRLRNSKVITSFEEKNNIKKFRLLENIKVKKAILKLRRNGFWKRRRKSSLVNFKCRSKKL
jgi:hypothetical protein